MGVASVGAPVKAAGGLNKSSPAPSVPTEAVHVALEEKIMMTVGRDGGLQGLEVLGFLTLRVADESLGRIRLELQNTTNFEQGDEAGRERQGRRELCKTARVG